MVAPMPRDLEPSSSLKAYFGWRLRHWRNVRGLTQRQLGERTGDSDDEISKIETAERWPPPGLAERCDQELGTSGELAALWPLVEGQRTAQATAESFENRATTNHMQSHEKDSPEQEVRPVSTRREVVGYLGAGMAALVADRMLNHPIVAALDANHRAGASSLGPGMVEDLDLTVESFRLSYGRTAPEILEPDLTATRQYVGSLLGGKLTLDQHRELVVLAGWLSALLGLTCFDLGHYAAAAVWCRDAEERAREARHNELAAWSREPLAIMAFYLDRPAEAIQHTRAGRAYAPKGSAAWAVHAAQEMRRSRGLVRRGTQSSRQHVGVPSGRSTGFPWRRAPATRSRLSITQRSRS
jgi:transcriptional regulator with XRE-family HTH domain